MKTNRGDLRGRRFGKYTVLGVAPRDGSRRSRLRVRCDCGTLRKVVKADLLRGNSKQCDKCRHRSREKLVTWGGTTANLATWADLLGLNRNTLRARLHYGHSLRQAFTLAADHQVLALFPRNEDPQFAKDTKET